MESGGRWSVEVATMCRVHHTHAVPSATIPKFWDSRVPVMGI